MTSEESKAYEVAGATGPGITIHVHEQPCALPACAQPRTYPACRS
ncbi:hypothetical protein ACFVT1_36195 [Streptomyces sp. NPDC057963]